MSDQDDHLSTKLSLCWSFWPDQPHLAAHIFTHYNFNRTSIFFQLFTSMSLLVRLACSYYYGVIFKILTGQKRDLTELKFLWPVNTTGNSPKFILSPTSELLITSNIYFFVFICFIIASYFHPISLVFSSLLKMKVLFWNFSSNYRKFQGQKNGFHELHIERSWNIILYLPTFSEI